ncbi:MAG: CDP-diacylglycerol--glycerol-3-phosphate 3-phosphatidyltransferase [Deltaproteobacteria bacterium]|nr:MAG: CDP-diacylglycerol--glycerol-3-phosphate 3-phosphatidyltransferase [Deltaproteobacteria bacterium]
MKKPPITGNGGNKDIWNLPNILTISRILAVPFFIILSLFLTDIRLDPEQIREKYDFFTILFLFPTKVVDSHSDKLLSRLAGLAFIVVSLTDMLDGYLARCRGSVTTLGRLLDPLADKLLIVTVLIMLIPLGRVPAWMVVLIVGRELAITGLRGMASSEGIVIPASKLGKNKTIYQLVAVPALLIHYEYYDRIDFHRIGMVFLWIALFLTLWSGIDYFRKYWARTIKT